MIERTKTIIANVTVVAVVIVALIWGDSWYRQRTLFLRGEADLSAGKAMAAIADYEAAIHMYTPASTLVEESAQRLWGLGESFEQAGDTARALIAYRALRSSFYAVRWFLQPGKEWIARCDGKIAEILQRQGYRQP